MIVHFSLCTLGLYVYVFLHLANCSSTVLGLQLKKCKGAARCVAIMGQRPVVWKQCFLFAWRSSGYLLTLKVFLLHLLLQPPLKLQPTARLFSLNRRQRPAPLRLTVPCLANNAWEWALHQLEARPAIRQGRLIWLIDDFVNNVRGYMLLHPIIILHWRKRRGSRVFFVGAIGFNFRLYRPLEITTWVAFESSVFYITWRFNGSVLAVLFGNFCLTDRPQFSSISSSVLSPGCQLLFVKLASKLIRC